MARHTPGPWNQAEGMGTLILAQKRDNHEQRIAQAIDQWGEHDYSSAEVHANARLIAAAPELYKFLDRAMPWLAKAKADGVFDNCGMPSELDRVFEMGNRIRDDIEAEA